MTDEQRKIMQLADAILDIVDNADSMDRGDLQGVVDALAMQTIRANK